MKIINAVRSTVTAIALISVLGTAPGVFANVITVGNDAIDRDVSDIWRNFVLSLATEVITGDGGVTGWEVYASNPGTLALLILDGIFPNRKGIDPDLLTIAVHKMVRGRFRRECLNKCVKI